MHAGAQISSGIIQSSLLGPIFSALYKLSTAEQILNLYETDTTIYEWTDKIQDEQEYNNWLFLLLSLYMESETIRNQ